MRIALPLAAAAAIVAGSLSFAAPTLAASTSSRPDCPVLQSLTDDMSFDDWDAYNAQVEACRTAAPAAAARGAAIVITKPLPKHLRDELAPYTLSTAS